MTTTSPDTRADTAPVHDTAPVLDIGGRLVGPGHPPFVIAELSGNHGGSQEKARELVHAAAEAGVDAVKLQTYTASSMVIDADLPELVVSDGGLWNGRRLADLYDEGSTPWAWHIELLTLARSLGLVAFSSAFDPDAARRLAGLDVPAIKIGSAELIDDELLIAAGESGVPVLVSTGMANRSEIDHAVDVLRRHAGGGFALLHCIAEYPTPANRAALGRLDELRSRYGGVIGWSDHTLGNGVATAAVALGADIVEKHLCLRRDDGDIDGAFSLEPDELADLVALLTDAHSATTSATIDLSELGPEDFPHRRSLRARRDLKPGDRIDAEAIGAFRPGGGLSPAEMPRLIGRRVSGPIAKGAAITLDVLEAVPCE